MKCLFFEPSLFLCFISCFSSLRRPYPLFVPCFYWFWAFLDITVLDFLLSIFFLGLFEKLSFCFGQKISKKISLILYKKMFFLLSKPLFFLILTNFCFKLVFFSFLFLLFFHVFFWKISCVFSPNPWVSVQKKIHLKNNSWFSSFYVSSPCIALFFSLFLSFHDSSPCVCSRYVYLLSFLCLFSLSLSLLCFFCSILFLEKSPSLTFRVFEKKSLFHFFIPFL